MTLSAAESIFLALADIAPSDRPAFIEVRCAGNSELRREVDAFVAALDLPDDEFLDPGRLPTLDMAAVDGPLQPGTRLGGFLVLHAIGSGGMGVVYAAQQERPRRTVAIKVLRRGFRHPEILRRFELEAEMLGRLQHPGIAQVYAFHPGDRSTPAHLVMELVAGPPLTDFARAEGLAVPARVALFVRLAEAVQHAHERGVVHRDLKPANVLVAEGGQPKVLDFGIARDTEVQRLTLQTAHGQLMGTLAYMSPEQLEGRPSDVDARSDVYALGVLLYRLLTDHAPVDVGGLTWPEAIRRLLDTDPAPASALNPLVSGGLDRVIGRAMARDARSRYQTAAELAADLARVLAGEQPSVRPANQRHERERWTAEIAGARAVAASADGGLIAVGLAAGVVELRDADTGSLVTSIGVHDAPVAALTFNGDGRLVVAWADGKVASLQIT